MSVTPSRYDSSGNFERRPGPEFMFEVEVIDGEEGKHLALEQARAIAQLLLWVRSQRRSHPGQKQKRDGERRG